MRLRVCRLGLEFRVRELRGLGFSSGFKFLGEDLGDLFEFLLKVWGGKYRLGLVVMGLSVIRTLPPSRWFQMLPALVG